jgi:hypothetical protein
VLTTNDLRAALREVSTAAGRLARQLAANGDLPPRVLAEGYVELGKLNAKLTKLVAKFAGGNGQDAGPGLFDGSQN